MLKKERGFIMLVFLVGILFIAVFVQGLVWSIKISWGIFKIIAAIIIYPIIFIGLCISGLIYVALIGLIILGIMSLVGLVTA